MNSDSSRIQAFRINANSRLLDNSPPYIQSAAPYITSLCFFPERDAKKPSRQRAFFKLVDA
jgi:hypothetical protein